MQQQEIYFHGDLRIILFKSFLEGESLNDLFREVVQSVAPETEKLVLSSNGSTSLETLLQSYVKPFEESGFFTSGVEIEKYVSKTYTQDGLFLFLGKADLSIHIQETSPREVPVSFGDLLSVRGGSPSVKVTSLEQQLFVLHFLETDLLSKYRNLPLKELEELAYAVQISYLPPLGEEQRESVLQGIRWILEHPNLTEEEREEMTKASRVKTCDNPNTPVGYDNVLLKSDAQLTFMADGDVYYCLDKIVDLPETLRQSKNLSNMKPLTSEQIAFLSSVQVENPYPRIVTGDYFDEVAFRLQGQVEPEIPLYRRRAEELAALVSGLGLIYSADSIISFANDLSVERYNEYLKHRSLRQRVEATERDAAAAEALGILLRYYIQKKQVSEIQGNIALMEIGKTVEEYVTMITRSWDYATLIQEMGVEGEVYWKPLKEYPDEEMDLIREGQIGPNGIRIGEWTLKYPEGSLYAKGSYDGMGEETGLWVIWHSNENKSSEGNYLNGEKTGLWIYWYENGTNISEGNYINGRKTGRWVIWHSNGNKYSEGNYLHGEKTGRWTTWHSNENKSSEGDYLNDQKTGQWIEWHENGIKSGEGDYLNGEKTGRWTIWHSSENKLTEGDYLNGEKTGYWIEWRENETKYSEGDYLNDRRTGRWTTWYEKGNKKEEGDYLNDKKTGRWTTWHDNGIKSEEGDYLNGQQTGRWTAWWNNGTKSAEGDYLNGQKTGRWNEWHNNGTKWSEGDYLNGQRSGHWTDWRSDETKYSEGDFLNGQRTGRWTDWWSNETKYSEGDFLNGQKTGRWTIWYENGNKNEEGDFLNGQKTGRWTTWYSNKNKTEGDYLHDQKTGRWIEWYRNGIKKSEGDYLHGQKTGRWTIWNLNETKSSEGDYLNGRRTGLWTVWYYNGIKTSEGDYLNGQQTGHWTGWHDNGNKKEEGNYINGLRTGRWVEWLSSENKLTEGDYLNGEKTGRWIEWRENGNKKEEGDYLNGRRTGLWIYLDSEAKKTD